MAPSTLARIEALCSWLQAGGIALSGSELNSWREECKALAALLFLQDKMVQNIGASIHQITSPGRLRAMVSLLTSCIHSPDALAKLSYDAASNIHFKAVVWASCYLDIDPGNGCPSSSQLAVAEVLLRAKVLQGCSRLLASATAAVAASGQATQRVRRQCLTRKSDEEARELDGALSTISCLLPPLASLCGVLQPDSPAPLTGQRASPSTTPNRDGSEGQAHAMELGFERQRGKKGQEEGLQAREADPGGVGHVAQPAGLFQQLVAALYDSSVLEHVARSVLVQAGYVWRMQQAGRQHSLAYGQLYAGLTNLCGFFAAQYGDLVIRRGGPKMPGADSPESTASAQRDAGGAQAQAHRGEAAPPTPHQQHTSTPTPPLAASGHGLDAAHSLLLGRVLSGPCACHLALCQGLRTLCALDGGGDYGLPEEAGLQGLPPCVIPDDEEEEEQHSRHVRLAAGPLQNLVAVLAMRRGEPGAEAEVQPPGRGTRLQLTLRVAHAAGGAKPEAGSSGSGSSQRYVVDQAEAAPIAVYALRMAWRHMPPPGGRARADRRRAALRRWAAAAERVARAGVAIGAVSHPLFGRHMALILRLHPSYVGPLEGPDLRSLASGGHLLRALEGLVSQVARAVGDQGPSCECTPTGGARLRTPIGWMLRSFIVEESCGVWPCPLRDLLLQPGEDEQPGAGHGWEGQGGEDAGQVGHSSGGGLRAAASLAVALGKLLRRCEGAVAESLAKCGGNAADEDFDTALEIVWAVCDVLLASPECAVAGAREERPAPATEGGEEADCSWEVRRRVWVCSYATWQWLPALASVARRAAAAGHVNKASIEAWLACLVWVTRLCLACCRQQRMAGVGLEARDGEGESVGDGTAGAGGGRTQLGPAGAAGGDGSCCSCRGCGAQGGCWREFLLRDVGVVRLLGAALSGLVPELLAGEEESRGLLGAVAEACVLATAAFPTEVAQYAWGPQGGAAGGAGGNSSGGSGGGASSCKVWSTKVLAEVATAVGAEQWGQPLAAALRALEQWGGECGSAGDGPVELSRSRSSCWSRRWLTRFITLLWECGSNTMRLCCRRCASCGRCCRCAATRAAWCCRRRGRPRRRRRRGGGWGRALGRDQRRGTAAPSAVSSTAGRGGGRGSRGAAVPA